MSEALPLSSVERIERALAVYPVVAWRIGLLMHLGRTCPEWDAGRLLTREERQAGWLDRYRHAQAPPGKTPILRKAVHMIAALGGFSGHKGNGWSGVRSLWLGLQRVVPYVEDMRFTQKCGQRDGSDLKF